MAERDNGEYSSIMSDIDSDREQRENARENAREGMQDIEGEVIETALASVKERVNESEQTTKREVEGVKHNM